MYNHLTSEERDQIAVWKAEGQSCSKIAVRLGRHKSSISREINRNKNDKEQYLSSFAQQKCEERIRKAHKRERIEDCEVKQYVEEKIKLGWSPDIISGRLEIDLSGKSISHECIYQYIYNDKPELGLFLPRGNVKRKPKSSLRKSKKTKIPNRTPLSERPKEVEERKEFGHYEADSIVSRASKFALNVVVERKSRFTFIQILENKTAQETLNGIIASLSDYTPSVVSITYDNGTEFAYHEEINTLLESVSYFCEPYHSWEKGSVENRNWFIRRFLPKKTDFATITKDNILKIQGWLNNRPMKCLKYKTPKEIFEQELKRCA